METVSVIDFRRQGLVLKWHRLGGTFTTYDEAPALVHGVALIRASQPNICIYAEAGDLLLQIGTEQYSLANNSPRVSCTRKLAGFGFRRRFSVQSSNHDLLYDHKYWTSRGQDFFHWLAAKTQDPEWRASSGKQWSEGLTPAKLRAA